MAPTPRRGQASTTLDLVGFRHRLESLRRRADDDAEEGRPPAGAAELSQDLGAVIEELRVAADDLVAAGGGIAALDGERRRYQELFELAPDAYIVTDPDGVVCEANRAATRLLDVPHHALTGQPLVLYVVEGERRRLLDRISALHRGEAVPDWDTVVAPRGGDGVPVSVRCAADTSGGSGHVLRWMLRVLDVPAGDLDGAPSAEPEGTGLRAETRRLAALDKVKSDFLDLVSHELRSPIGVARGYVSMLSDGTLGEVSSRAASVLPVVLGKLDEMARLVDQMLDTARLEDSRLHQDAEPLDLGDLAATAVARMPSSARHRVVFDREDASLICVADAARVLTTIANLLDNAVKYSPDGGEVRCTARRQGAMAAVSVRDQGIGLDETGMARLFTRFGRVPSRATAGIPGTGLGLYLARETARRHGGDVTVSAQPGAGSAFTLTLPLHRG